MSPSSVKYLEPESSALDVTGFPDGTYLLHYYAPGDLMEIGRVMGGNAMCWLNVDRPTEEPDPESDWGPVCFWHIAIPPGAAQHDLVTAVTIAARLGMWDPSLLGGLETGPWIS